MGSRESGCITGAICGIIRQGIRFGRRVQVSLWFLLRPTDASSMSRTAIAHCIREQINVYQRSLVLVGYPSDGWMTQDEDLRIAFLPTLMAGARPMDQVQSYTPTLNYLSDGEIERSEKEREKELTKRRKRNTRGRRGIALPDREPNRTYRTPAVGFPELDPATLALAVAANAPTSRRAAAAAASLTIANMVASENGTPIMPLQLPPQQSTVTIPAVSGKEKKPKGLFKPPSYPPTILHPRARVNAPTPSTAVESKLMLPSSLLEDEPPPPVVNTAPPDLKAAAKRAREAEKEAKEKELAEGQHANVINGVWHCSNCGCPESIAIGRRKGPLGDKSQCGTCGKLSYDLSDPKISASAKASSGIGIEDCGLCNTILIQSTISVFEMRLSKRRRAPRNEVVHRTRQLLRTARNLRAAKNLKLKHLLPQLCYRQRTIGRFPRFRRLLAVLKLLLRSNSSKPMELHDLRHHPHVKPLQIPLDHLPMPS